MSRGAWTELLAELVLESEGYEVTKRRERVLRGGEEVGEVDLIVRKGGETYAVEVKAGRISVSDVRQAYTNAKLLGARPLLVARGFSDPAAEALARELGVEVLLLPDYFHFVSPEELAATVEQAVVRVLDQLLPPFPPNLEPEEVRVLEALALSDDLREAALRLGIPEAELGRRLGELRSRGLLPQARGFAPIRLRAKLLLLLWGLAQLTSTSRER